MIRSVSKYVERPIAIPWRSPPDRSPTVESALMPAPRKPIGSSSSRFATSF
jgi:hypothetical protein